MTDVSFVNLLVISIVAVLAPLLAGSLPRLPVTAVVLKIVAGVVVRSAGWWVRMGRLN